jgi:hypothetical protein
MKRIQRFAATALLLLTGLFFVSECEPINAQTRADRNLINQAERITGDDFAFETKTPKGAVVYAVRQPTAAMLRAVDTGLTNLFAIARKHNYRVRLNYSDYTIFIARADRRKDSSGNYSPDIAIGAAQYAGSIYDQGGYVYAAGMVLSFNPSAFIFAEHDRNLERVSDVVRYEGEHIILFHNDRRLYNQTFDHSKGGGHPILD